MYRKSNISEKIFRRTASGAEEEAQRNRRDLPGDKNTRKKRKRKAKAVAIVERQWSTPSRPKLPSIQTAVLKVWQIQSFCVMLYN